MEQIYQNLHAKVANLNCFQHLAVFQNFKNGGSELWPLITRSTAHSRPRPPDGRELGEREGARGVAGEAPAAGEGLRGGSVASEVVLGGG